MSNRLTTEEFITKAKSIHGNKYDYSKVEYANTATKVCIICPEHGEFWQKPSSHLRGRGCPACGNLNRGKSVKLYRDKNKKIKQKINSNYQSNKIKTNEIFISELKELYGDRLLYDEINYVNSHTKVWITDTELNYRYQITPTHLLTRGLKQKKTLTQDVFIDTCNELYKGQFNYDKTVIVDAQTKVCIICPEHGEFWQKPYYHMKGSGCPYCNKKQAINKNKKDINTFITQSNKIHGNFYNYDKFIYTNYHTKSYITCPEHGDFLQTPAKHILGHGCPKCNESYLERELRLFLDSKNIDYECQFTDVWLKHKNGIQYFDFSIKGTKILIECQGIQHFVSPNFKYKTDLSKIIERDIRKYNKATEQGYIVLYYTTEDNIKYKPINEIYNNNIYTDVKILYEQIIKISNVLKR